MLYCDDGDGSPPELRKWRPQDELSPEPPPGWLIATQFVGPVHPIEVGIWLCILHTAQIASKRRESRLHAISRNGHGSRVLLVHPKLREEVAEAMDFVYGAVTDCSCGGGDCLEPKLQQAAAKVIARRRWNALSTSDRIGYLQDSESDADISLAFDGMDEVAARGHADVMDEIAYHSLRIPTKAATYSNLIAATIPI